MVWLQRLLVLALLFATKLLLLSVWLDNSALISQGGLIEFVDQLAAWTVVGLVGFAVISVTFAYLGSNAALLTQRSLKWPLMVQNVADSHFP